VNPELLFKVPSGLHRENTSVRFLTENILGPLDGTTTLEKRESPENFFLFVVELGLGICRGSRSLRMRGHCDILY